MNGWDLLVSLGVGLSLAAASGFRVFVPMLALSIAANTGHLELSPGFQWLGSWPAVAALGTATAVEVAAYYVPWLDNLLDAIATPAALVAGTVVTAAALGDANPMLRWSLAAVAGGGAAVAIQGLTVAALVAWVLRIRRRNRERRHQARPAPPQ
jgi:hypothetical protein